MVEISFHYWNALAGQIITTSSLLAGFSIAIIANILVSDMRTKLMKRIMVAATLAASFFLVTVFAMTKLLLMTTDGFPSEVTESHLQFPRTLGTITFFFGIMGLIAMISLAGWTKSPRMGKFTTGIGILTFLLILLLITSFG